MRTSILVYVKTISELVYLGDARYGVMVNKSGLQRARACSKTVKKYTLNLVELVLTFSECKDNMTVYGEGKDKRPCQQTNGELFEVSPAYL